MLSASHQHGLLPSSRVRTEAQGRWRDILAGLNIQVPATAKQHGPCPVCGGKDRFRFDDQEGRGTWFCNQCDPKAGDGFDLVRNVRGCDFPTSVSLVGGFLGMERSQPAERRISDTYDYVSEAGDLIFQVVRFLPKDFRQRRPNGHGGWIWDLKGIEPVLYKLPDVLRASHVLVVEGEKDVETASRLGLPEGWAATCNPMGAGKWQNSYTEALTGKHVVILPDSDAAGRDHGELVAASIRTAAASVHRLTVGEGHKDLSAWADDRPSGDFHALLQSRLPWASSPALPASVSVLSVPVSGDWPEIQPIKAELLPVNPLPVSLIPLAFRDWVKDVSDRMQCPIDFVAAPMLVMAGAVIGAGCGIRPKKHDDWTVVPNLWGGVIGRPSMLKTPAISEAFKPLETLEAEAKLAYDAAIKDHLAEVEAYEAHKEALKADMRSVAKGKASVAGHALPSMDSLKYDLAHMEEPRPPIWRRYKTNDATIEKMAALQSENERGLLLFRDELVGLLATWDKEDHQSDRAFYLEGFNGLNSYTADRIGRGHIYTPHNCVSLFGGIQPTKLSTYLYAAMRGRNNDGLVQRLQVLVYPDEPADWRLVDTPINRQARDRAYHAIRQLATMDFRQSGAYGDESSPIPYYRFDDAGQAVLYGWLAELEQTLRTTDAEPVVVEHLGKYRSLMPSLALIFHLLDLVTGGPSAPRQVSQENAERAAGWCDYLEQHARRVYGLVTNAACQGAARLAEKLQDRALEDGFTVRDVYIKGWSLLTEKESAANACYQLITWGWLREEHIPTAPGHRGKTIYHINPKVTAHG